MSEFHNFLYGLQLHTDYLQHKQFSMWKGTPPGSSSRAASLGREINRTEMPWRKLVSSGQFNGQGLGEGVGTSPFMAEGLNEYNSASRGQCRH